MSAHGQGMPQAVWLVPVQQLNQRFMAASTLAGHQPLATPTPAFSSQPESQTVPAAMKTKDAAASTKTRRRITGKQAPLSARKQPRGGCTSASSAGGKGWAAVAPSADATEATAGQQEKRPMPAAPEETWEERHSKRRNMIAVVKATSEYEAFWVSQPSAASSEFDGCVPAPTTPDPMDRNISKRHWDAVLKTWRKDLRAWRPASNRTFQIR
mmetsp:Transcript_10247/g.35887  ORF Transcript_10247/g.35887 Transcript_10247/m.35887 type:complete len:212 (-) Transcript_10247:111-746(-)